MDDRIAGDALTHSRERVVELEQLLWLLLGDVKARAVSCTCGPPLTTHERYHIERAEALLADFQPDDK